MNKIFFCVLFFCAQFSAIVFGQSVNLNVTSLKVEGRKNLPGLDLQHPRLSWQIGASSRGVEQAAYQIIVASSLEKLQSNKDILWNTGQVKSNTSLNIIYQGDLLKSCKTYYWKVKVWTNKGQSAWSAPAKWSMGILEPTQWKAQWIGLDTFSINDRPYDSYTRLAARYLRKQMNINKQVSKATAYISGLGLYELYINGKKVGNDVLSPTLKEYNKVVPYNTLDVTSYLKKGDNAIGVILGNGRFFTMRYGKTEAWITGIPPITNYGYPKLLMQVLMEYSDGTTSIIHTDQSWKITTDGPILANSEFDGEEYDSNKEFPNWSQPGFKDTNWQSAQLVASPANRIESQLNENIIIKQTLKPKSISKTKNGTYIVDMGQNMVGWLKISVKGNKGDTIRMRFAETMKNKDSLYMANIRNAKVTDKYILKGSRQEVWEPRFTYHGFRFVEIKGLSYTPTINDFTGKIIYDDIATTGSFESSNKTLNQIFTNAHWTIKGNYRGMPSDCPQRDERMGWLGDRSANSYGESFLFDNSRLYAKWIYDMKDAQKESGSIPDVVPTYWKFYNDNVTWPASYIIIPDMLRRQFGDIVTFRENYPAMKKWMLYMWANYKTDDLILKDNYGDWCLPPESLDIIVSKDKSRNTQGPLLASAYYYYCLQLMEQYAVALKLYDDKEQFTVMAQKVKVAFNKKFYHADSTYYANNTVTSNLLPLTFGLAPEKDRKAIFNQIVQRTLNMYDGHVSTGLVGGQWMMRGLSENGRPDLAYRIASNTTYPSWGYMIGQGATTIWELWNGNTANPAMNSGNHVMLLGDLLIWYYEYLGGIKSDNQEVAFKKIIMDPYIPQDLNYVNASYQSVYGLIESRWKKTNGVFTWQITIPANTSAMVYFPANSVKEISESGKPVMNASGIRFLKTQDGKTQLELGSGSYSFSARWIK